MVSLAMLSVAVVSVAIASVASSTYHGSTSTYTYYGSLEREPDDHARTRLVGDDGHAHGVDAAPRTFGAYDLGVVQRCEQRERQGPAGEQVAAHLARDWGYG